MLFGKEHIFRKLTMEKESKNLLAIIFFVVAIGVVLVVVDLSAIVDKETEATIISIVGGVIAIVGLILFYQRLKKQEEQIAQLRAMIVLLEIFAKKIYPTIKPTQ